VIARALVVFVVLTGSAGVIARAEHTEPVQIRNSFALFPMQIGDWRGVQEPPFEKRVLEVLGVNDYLTRAYFRPDRAGVGLYIGYWESQRQGDTIHSPLNCLPGAGWTPASKSMMQVANGIGDGRIEVNRYLVRKGLDSQLILYWYQSHGRVIASEYWSRFFLIRDAVEMNRTDGAIVRVIAPVRPDVENAESVAEGMASQFITALFPVLPAYLPN
jgi:EpsI family protein